MHGNDIKRQAVPDRLVYEPFLVQALRQPNAPAILSQSRSLTYGELETLTRAWAARLQRFGVKSGEPVAIVMEKGWEQIVAAVAILRAGAAYLPIDAEMPAARLAWMLGNARVRVVLTQQRLAERLTWPEDADLLAVDSEHPAAPATLAADKRTPDELAYLLYTSGSTGTPKGVMIAHRGVANCIAQTNYEFSVGSHDRAIAITALHHDMSVYDIFGILTAGGALVVPDAPEAKDPAAWVDLIRQHRVTIWNSVPAFLEMLLGQMTIDNVRLPGTLRLLFAGGDWIPLTAPARARKHFGPVEFVSVGGPTETSVWNIWYRAGQVDPAWRSIPYGRPIPHVSYHILDEDLNDCPVGATGELCCSGTGLALGYWGDEKLTAAKFIQHPRTGERLYRTGDLGRWMEDGNIEFAGRRDNQVKINGQRIELGEVESALSRLPGVQQAIALVHTLRSGEKQLVAVVRGERSLTRTELLQALRAQLPPHMVPAALRFVEELPLNSNGKVDRPALLALFGQAATAASAVPAAANNGADTKGLEENIAVVWRQVLELPEVAHDANFFDLGGRSLQLMRVRVELATRYKLSAPVTEFLRNPTVKSLALFFAGRDSRSEALSAAEERAQRQKEMLLRRRQTAR